MRKILEEALTECSIEFDRLVDDGEGYPGDVQLKERPFCYCDPIWKTKYWGKKGDPRCTRNSSAITSSQEDASDQFEDDGNCDDSSEASDEASEGETASAPSVRYSDPQANHQ